MIKIVLTTKTQSFGYTGKKNNNLSLKLSEDMPVDWPPGKPVWSPGVYSSAAACAG